MPRPFSSCALAALSAASLLASNADAYGPEGHRIVGAIADERLAGSPTAAKIRTLLQGYPLEKAALIPDEIRGWDTNGVDDPKAFRYSSRRRLDAELAGFWRANPPTHDRSSPVPSHHWFHYTDVPVLNGQKYADGKEGRSPWDVVHMIRYCVAVLNGDEPEENARKISKPIAIILLAHFVGDIHQPLHVGAHYFDETGRAVDPDQGTPEVEAQGGNTIVFKHSPAAAKRIHHRKSKLHGFWDTIAVTAYLPDVSKAIAKEERRALKDAARKELISQMAKEEPKEWRLPNVPLTGHAEAWANEILPIAREAYERLEFRNIVIRQEEGNPVASGEAIEKPPGDKEPYYDWSSGVTRAQLHKAGWRLADLFEKALP
ncbi:MAG: S1/P1 nuclease [Verrucomicrobiota bacterium]|nr:S1/P1 nuclease [Verrucomicrobiota bacterium]